MERRRFFGALGGLGVGVLGAGTMVSASASGQAACRAGENETPHEIANDVVGADRMHLPIVSLPARPRLGRAFDLVVRVGDPTHEQRQDHHIAWIEVRYGADRLFVCDLSPDVPFPVVRVPVVLRRADELAVRFFCTRHGTFLRRRPLTPT
jgi:desulfoferrodoxin (superoxide reductase-like protein)